MKKSKQIFLVFLWSVCILISCKRPCETPERPEGIPSEARWHGGCDGGYWLYLLEANENKYRFKVFVDYDSTVLMDADFIPSDNCVGLQLPKGRAILEHISVVEPDKILVKLDNEKFCSLIPVYPAYGGFTWEIIKKKGNY